MMSSFPNDHNSGIVCETIGSKMYAVALSSMDPGHTRSYRGAHVQTLQFKHMQGSSCVLTARGEPTS